MPPSHRDPRRHDLDALRGVAMLLGIVLHAALAYVPGIPWPVHDARLAPWLGLVVIAIHGFRMPLFFLVSGFFTALLWRRGGVAGMLRQRFTRVFIPLVLASVTLLPALGWMTPRGLGQVAAGKAAAPVVASSPRGADGEPDAAAGDPRPRGRAGDGPLARVRGAYRNWLLSPDFILTLPPNGEPRSLLVGRTFSYLWFLWFLCWYAAGFAAVATAARMLHVPGLPRRLVGSSAALLWVVPLSLVPQLFMGLFRPSFGPDTSLGLLPQPHVLAYYAVFFGSGAVLFLAGDDEAAVGRRWPILLAVALLVCLPAGLATMARPAITAVPQVLYAWLMCFGCIGLFRWLVPTESRGWRYLSDSSYWLYLAHLPLLILIQKHSRDWPWPAPVKFVLVCAVATAVLLASYQLLVRHTPLGVLLNGPRRRDEPSAAAGGPR